MEYSINILGVGSGTSHTLNAAFDGLIRDLKSLMVVESYVSKIKQCNSD